MNRENALVFAEGLGLKVKPGGSWLTVGCPLAPWRHEGGKDGHPSMGVSLPGPHRRSIVKCLSCGWTGSPFDLVTELKSLGALPPDSAEAVAVAAADGEGSGNLLPAHDETPLEAIPDWWLDSFPSWRSGVAAVEYVAARQTISGKVMDFLDARWDSSRRRVCFPIRDAQGSVRGLRGRAVDPDVRPKYLLYKHDGVARGAETMINADRVDLDRPVVLVEGPFDLAGALGAYDNCGAAGGTSPHAAVLEYLAGAVMVVTLLDPDTPGDLARERLSKRLKTRVRHVKLSGGGDPGATSPDQIWEAIKKHVAAPTTLV